MKRNTQNREAKSWRILGMCLVAMAAVGLSVGCASTGDGSGGGGLSKDEICDEADAGTEGCPG